MLWAQGPSVLGEGAPPAGRERGGRGGGREGGKEGEGEGGRREGGRRVGEREEERGEREIKSDGERGRGIAQITVYT